MKIFSANDEIPQDLTPVVLTIGNFDGVHLGHQALLERGRQAADKISGHLLVLTFSNHPAEILRPDKPIRKLCTFECKLRLLESHGVEGIILFEFTHSFAKQTAEAFLFSLRSHFLFHSLVLGHDARLGSDRQKVDSPYMQHLAKKMGFFFELEPAHYFEGDQIVSSSLIRQLIEKGDFSTAEKMLGRPFA